MEGVKAADYGLLFVWECLKRYLGRSWPVLAVFLAGLVFSAVLIVRQRRAAPADGLKGRGGDTQKAVTGLFLTVLAVMLLTFCNPFAVKALIPKLGMSTVYYRVFWAVPIAAGAAYYLVLGSCRVRRRGLGLAAFFGALALLAAVCPADAGIRNFSLPDNVYKVKGSVPVLCDAIHEDYEQSTEYRKLAAAAEMADIMTDQGAAAHGRMLPKCVFPADLEFQVRQYDPGISLTVERNMRLYYEGNMASGISYEGSVRYERRRKILDGMYGRDESLRAADLKGALRRTATRYLVVETAQANDSLLQEAGCVLIGQKAGFNLYSFGVVK